MAVVNTKSTAVTNADTTNPRVNTPHWIEKAGMFSSVGTVEVAAADSDDSVYRMVRIPSGARINRIEVFSDAITGASNYDVGLYTAADGSALSQALFASGLDLSTGNTDPLDITFEAQNISTIESRLWELLAATRDPFVQYDICLTGVTAGIGAGTISLRVEYVV